MSRTLYFEGVGTECQMSQEGAIHRMRIRTAFHGHCGSPIFMEVSSISKFIGFKGKHPVYEKAVYAHFDTYEEIESEIEMGGRTFTKWEHKAIYSDDMIPEEVHQKVNGKDRVVTVMQHTYRYRYTEEDILKYLSSIGYDFDAVVVLPDLSGYRAIKDDCDGSECPYNYGDEFEPDWDLIARREQAEEKQYRQDISDGIKAPCFSMWPDAKNPELLHYKNYRRKSGHELIKV